MKQKGKEGIKTNCIDLSLVVKCISLFTLGIILELIFTVYINLTPRGTLLWSADMEFIIMPFLTFLIELYGLSLFIYFICKRYSIRIWILPFLNILGLLIFIFTLIMLVFIINLDLVPQSNLGYVLPVVSFLFYGLKLLSLIFSVVFVWKNK